MNSPADAWNKFWFEPSHATNLGVCRVVAFAVILWNYGARDFSAWSDVDAVFWVPMWFFALFKIPPASVTTMVVLQLVWKGRNRSRTAIC